MNRKLVFLGAALALLLTFAVAAFVYNSGQKQAAARQTAANLQSLSRSHAPTLGRPGAKVHIVEFLDPACETCRAFYPHVKQMLAAEPERLRLSLRLVPLHRGSIEVVKMLEAARNQDKYWQVLEALLAAQSQWVIQHVVQPEQAWRVLAGLGLNLDQLKSDMNAPEVLKRIEQDGADARALNVTKTPEYFVNGRPLPSFGLEELQQLVAQTLREAY
ncbi:Disulfide bond formation protein DsbA [Rubrivivax sp. A210]|uniref:DsbA family protein n=1 Tax=Rubrivivax sp. A210 TaxID=2772301 RepID=UPI001919F93B|nr:thioredoxin domain-containing protein [Rubrivivax sp. A210]CAD5373091.1 Disulfide bond formation protein DsbA [Rubrivivax sp. A210]